MFGVHEYIKQNTKAPEYSITKWVVSATVGGAFQATINEVANTPKFILINCIYISLLANAGASQLSITDQVGNVLMNQNVQSTTGNFFSLAISYVFKSTTLTLTTNTFGGGFNFGGFSVGYQYISEK